MIATPLSSPSALLWRLGVHLFCALPLGLQIYGLLTGELGPDPAKAWLLGTGEVALRLLLLCLTISPLRRLTGQAGFLSWRRPLGLWAFAWTAGHLTLFIIFYLGWDFSLLWEELAEHPYISVGFISLMLMLPLAATSSRAAIRRLGPTWRRLHRLIYPAALLALLHLIWQIREEWGEAFFYSAWLGLLLGERLLQWLNNPGKATGAN